MRPDISGRPGPIRRTVALVVATLLGLIPMLGAADRALAAPAAHRTGATTVIGRGTPRSCTSAAVVAAVRRGGLIRFRCGRRPVTIVMRQTAEVPNTVPRVVIDGGGLVTLSGAGRRRIIYMNTCDRSLVWTSPHCNNQATPVLVVERIAFTRGNSTGQTVDGGGGGAIFALGGQLRILDARFTRNHCDPVGQDLGGGAVRAMDQLVGAPIEVTNSIFTDNRCSNGGALSSDMSSWTITNSRFVRNAAIGYGANPARSGTPGGGSGGAIYNDGNTITLTIAHCTFIGNRAREGGGAIFFVSDDRTGHLNISDSSFADNPNAGFHTPGLTGVYSLGSGTPSITNTPGVTGLPGTPGTGVPGATPVPGVPPVPGVKLAREARRQD